MALELRPCCVSTGVTLFSFIVAEQGLAQPELPGDPSTLSGLVIVVLVITVIGFGTAMFRLRHRALVAERENHKMTRLLNPTSTRPLGGHEPNPPLQRPRSRQLTPRQETRARSPLAQAHPESGTARASATFADVPVNQHHLEAGTRADRPDALEPKMRGNGETVFVVVDEASRLMVIQEELETLGYRVISATSGAAAHALIEQGVQFDLVIADRTRPGDKNGRDLAARLRSHRHRSGLLYMSGARETEIADHAWEHPLMVAKSASPRELARAVKNALDRRLH